MLSRIAFVLISSLAVPAFAGPEAGSGSSPTAPAKTGPGTAVVKQANETIASLLKQKAAPGSDAEKTQAKKVTESVRSFLNIDELGRAAMVNQWSKLTPAQQAEFLKVLRDLIEANYINGLRANLAYTVAYVGEGANKAGQAVVNTKITAQRKGRPYTIAIDYVLVKDLTGLRAFDIVTDGVGLVENYRQMFDKIITDKGFPALIEKMKKKLDTINASPPPAPGSVAPVPAAAAKG
ncbi:MAG: Toluene tolerance precursor [Deltaproteobacteria bacterium]|nr:Toluene tolerance precursor [Deltaproteobacteria bacterium]